MDPAMVIIENHDENGEEWGVSLKGPNPPAEEFVKCRDKAHAVAVKAAYDQGILTPFLEAAGACKPEEN